MAMRKIKNTDIVGKTVKAVRYSGVNMVRVSFTDGSSLKLWAEQAMITPYGAIPGIFVDTPTKRQHRKK